MKKITNNGSLTVVIPTVDFPWADWLSTFVFVNSETLEVRIWRKMMRKLHLILNCVKAAKINAFHRKQYCNFSKIVSVLQSALVEKFSVSHMQDLKKQIVANHEKKF